MRKMWTRLKAVGSIKAVKAGKLLARKRPLLIPVVDKWVVAALAAPSGQYWHSIRDGPPGRGPAHSHRGAARQRAAQCLDTASPRRGHLDAVQRVDERPSGSRTSRTASSTARHRAIGVAVACSSAASLSKEVW